MSYNLSAALKLLVADRAGHRCEYCRMLESYSHYRFHVEHIIAQQHGGSSLLFNLAYACAICNWKKGTNLSSILFETGSIIRLFHPRKDEWTDHFEAENGVIYPKTEVGAVTIKLLEMNTPDNIIERKALMEMGLYP